MIWSEFSFQILQQWHRNALDVITDTGEACLHRPCQAVDMAPSRATPILLPKFQARGSPCHAVAGHDFYLLLKPPQVPIA